VALLYVQKEIKAQNEALYNQMATLRQISPIRVDSMERASDIDGQTFLVCAAGASKQVTRDVTEQLQGVRLGRAHREGIVRIFEDAGENPGSDKFYAAIAIALKSDDPALAPYLIRGFSMREPRYYGPILRWLERYGTADHVTDLEAVEPAHPKYRDWESLKGRAIEKMGERFE
jgi:hypothetical protein